MDRHELVRTWDEAWQAGLWAAAWPKALADLSGADAARQPAPGRHSIWQILNHIVFWREVAVSRAGGGASPSDADVARRNFEAPVDHSDAAWKRALARFEESQHAVRSAMLDESKKLDSLAYLAPHDSYHIGQIMYVRALLGKPSIE
ncbi:MAG: DinB family protein [Phycisphaerae bacterium]